MWLKWETRNGGSLQLFKGPFSLAPNRIDRDIGSMCVMIVLQRSYQEGSRAVYVFGSQGWGEDGVCCSLIDAGHTG